MSGIDYAIDILLIAVVFRQLRARELTPSSVFLPVILVGVASLNYLRPFAPHGNDLAVLQLRRAHTPRGRTLVNIAAGADVGEA